MTTQIDRPEATDVLDASGLLCPLPVYKAALALQRLEAGQILQLICTDPGSLQDIPALARQRGDVLVTVAEEGGTQKFWIEKGDTQ